MPRVPTLDPTIRTSPTVIPQPTATPVVREAFGENVAAAHAQLGQQLEKTADVGVKAIIAIRQRNDEKQVLDAQTAFQSELQNTLLNQDTDEHGVPKGFLSRQLGQATGSTRQFDDVAPKLKEKYLGTVTGNDQKMQMLHALDTHLSSAREQVIRNEASQMRLDYQNSLESNIKSNVAAAAGIDDPKSLSNAIKVAQAAALGGFTHVGMDEATAKFQLGNIAGEMAKSSINGLLETNPLKAKEVFDANKADLPANYQAELGKVIDGKILADQQLATWNQVKNIRLSDGMADLGKMHDEVMKLNVPTEKKNQIWEFIKSNATVSDTEIKQKREANDRAFTNDLVTQHSKNLPYPEALVLATKYAYDPTDIANKQEIVTTLYSGKMDNFDLWINKQPEPTQAAWEYAKQTLKGKYPESKMDNVPGYPSKVHLYDAALQELKLDSLGKSPEDIRKIANEKVKDVVITPHTFWFDEKAPAWQKDAGTREAIAEAYTVLEKSYGKTLVNQARAFVTRINVDDTPANVMEAIKSIRNGNSNGSQYETQLSAEDEQKFKAWKSEYAPHDSGYDYDLRGAFKAGLKPGRNGHWDDRFKKPNHPTFSVYSQYAKDRPDLAGTWEGDTYVPPKGKRK